MAHTPHPPSSPRTLVLADGGLPGLLAIAMAAEAAPPSIDEADDGPHVVCPLPLPGADEEAVRHAILRQAELYALAVEEWSPGAAGEAAEVGEASVRLVRAALLAAGAGCRRVVWPVQVARPAAADDPDLDEIGLAVDRALLVTRLASLDAPSLGVPDVRVETPFVDLADDQIADLASDLRVPIETCWWFDALGAHAAGERRRWEALIRVLRPERAPAS